MAVENANEAMRKRVEEAAKTYRVNYEEVPLNKPFDIAGGEVDILYMREPVAIDIDCLEPNEDGGGTMQGVREMICTLCGVGKDALDALPLQDYSKLMKRVEPFLDIAM